MLSRQRHFLIVFLTIFGLLAYPVCANLCLIADSCCEQSCSGCEIALPDCRQDIVRPGTVTLEFPVLFGLALVDAEKLANQIQGTHLDLFLPTTYLAHYLRSHPHTGPPTA